MSQLKDCSLPSMNPNVKGTQVMGRDQDRFINWNEYTPGAGAGTGACRAHMGVEGEKPFTSLLILLCTSNCSENKVLFMKMRKKKLS